MDNGRVPARGEGLGSRSLFPVDFLAPLVALLRLDRKRGNGPGIEPFEPDRFAGIFAKAVSAVFDARQRRLNF